MRDANAKMGFILSMKGRVRDAMTAIPFGVNDSEMKRRIARPLKEMA